MGSRPMGTEPCERWFVLVSPSSVAVLAVKRAEQQEAIIIRLQERAGQAAEGRSGARHGGSIIACA
jgi:alpha-mannosidase